MFELIGVAFVATFVVSFILFLTVPKDSKVYKVVKNICIGYDQLFNTFLLGYPDETISSRAYKRSLQGSKGWGLLLKFLELLDPGHGRKAVEWDEGTKKPEGPLIEGTKTKQQ